LTLIYVGSKTSSGSAIMGYWNASKPSPDSNLQARRLYRFFHDPLNQNVSVQEAATIQAIISGLNNFYEGATVSLDKRFSRGLAFGFYYTFGKADGESSGPQDGPPGQDPRNWRDARGPLPFDRRHSAVANFEYELPYRRGGKGPLGWVLGVDGRRTASWRCVPVSRTPSLKVTTSTRAAAFAPTASMMATSTPRLGVGGLILPPSSE